MDAFKFLCIGLMSSLLSVVSSGQEGVEVEVDICWMLQGDASVLGDWEGRVGQTTMTKTTLVG